MKAPRVLVLLFETSFISRLLASCYMNCNKNGMCSQTGVCECFPGWSGYDCSLRSCPTGPAVAGMANDTDSAHEEVTCSGGGTCDHLSGLCHCFPGYHGTNCGHFYCMNNCNGRGACISLRSSAQLFDGYHFNRTTAYSRWDSDLFYGCKCDPGWAGADCSERICEHGVDPRISNQKYELISLVCECSPTCSGKVMLQAFGQKSSTWLKSSASMSDVIWGLRSIPTLADNESAYIVDASNSSSWRLCRDSASTRTLIKVHRKTSNMPMVSFYANLISGGSIYFETNQTISCDCTGEKTCNGTLRISFDGEFSRRISTFTDVKTVVSILNSFSTTRSAQIGVRSPSNGDMCISGRVTNHTLIFNASVGNVPKIGLWISLLESSHPYFYTSTNTSDVISLSVSDGRDDSVKLCNGIGTCNSASGVCSCPMGWGPDSELGPCGRLTVNTSRWGGIGRCPGVVSPDDLSVDLTSKQNYKTRLFISMNPSYNKIEGVSSNFSSNRTISSIEYYSWDEGMSPPWPGPHVEQATRRLFLNMSSNISAGPVVVDEAGGYLFFIDKNPAKPFIGRALLSERNGLFDIWLRLNDSVFGLTMDAHFNRRRLYWTAPGLGLVADGVIFWASMDSEAPAPYYTLNAVIGQDFILDPMGIAVHYNEGRIYWVDKNISTSGPTSCLRSCKFDGSDYSQVFLYRTVDNQTVSANASDLIIDFYHNNTAFFIDKGNPVAIIATNLDSPLYNSTGAGDRFSDMENARAITSTLLTSDGIPEYLAIDDWIDVLLWSDLSSEKVKFLRFVSKSSDPYSPGIAYKPFPSLSGSCANSYSLPVGLAFDRGLGRPSWGPYLDCFGNGKCTGLSGNWVCDCFKGAHGNCAARNCPSGRAWWHKPVGENTAHDELVECSNMGRCDRFSGQCSCRPGFEGSACNRMSCQGQGSSDYPCRGKGRCLSMRELATKRVNTELDPSPVVYGKAPHDPNSWDADMIFGCFGDVYGFSCATGIANITSYVGQRLDEVECPVAYDTRLGDYNRLNVSNYNSTYGKEIQGLLCVGTSGYFSLQFRGATSSAIPANSSIEELASNLRSLTTLGQVKLQPLDSEYSGSICSSNGQTTFITFISQLGSIPLISLSKNSIDGGSGSISIWRSQRSSGILKECAGKGYCDRRSGQCSCWPTWGSSDGFGERGTRGDCGHSLVS